jgi:aspartyl protease/PDZ domain-containing protein
MACALACLAATEAEPRMRESEPVPGLPVVVPFPECGSTVLLPVRVNGHEPRLFILDSGANSIALDHGFADSLGLRPAGAGAGSGAGAGPVPYRRYPRDSIEFEVAGVWFRSDHTISIDLSNQPGILGYSVAGVLGSDFFRRVTVEIDYDTRIVRLHDPDRFTPPAGARSIPLIFERRVPFATALLHVEGRPARARRLLVDSGSEDAVDDSLLLESRGPLRRTIGGVGSGQTYEVVFGRIERCELGPFVLENLPSAAPGVSLIGGEVLRRFRVTLDYARERMLLIPGNHFEDQASEDLSGLTLRLAGDGARLRVEEVDSGSAAEKAGLRRGELLVAIDGAPVRVLGLRRAQGILMVPGVRLRLQIESESGLREVELALPMR